MVTVISIFSSAITSAGRRKSTKRINYQLVGVGRAYGPPTEFEGAQPLFYRNDGDGTFTEVAKEAGFHVQNPSTGVPVAKALAVLPSRHRPRRLDRRPRRQ